MKKPILATSLLFAATCTWAQGTDVMPLPVKKPKYRNEVNLHAETSIGSNNTNSSFTGVQFRHKMLKNRAMSWRLGLEYGSYGYMSARDRYVTSLPNTIRTISTEEITRMGVINGGLDFQKRLVKKLFIYGAAEARIGVGRTQSHQWERITYLRNNGVEEYMNRSSSSLPYTSIFSSLTPIAGIKFELTRIVFGIETSCPATLIMHDSPTGAGSGVNFDIAGINQRCFIGFRF